MSGYQKNKQAAQGTREQQLQGQIQKEDQIQREIQYYIYKDLENILLMLGELEQTIETFKYIEDKSYLPVAFNKVILQANLSYGIHYDQYNSNKNTHEKVFEDLSNDAIKIFEEVFETNEDGTKKAHSDPTILQICEFYKQKNFKTNKEFQQLPLQQVSRQPQFNEKSLDKVIWGIQAVDKEFNDIHEKPYPKPKAEELKNKILERKKFCEEQLKKNFTVDKNIKPNTDIEAKIQTEDETNKKERQQNTEIPAQNNKDTQEGIQKNKDNIETELEQKESQDTILPIQNSQKENTAPDGLNYGKLGPKPQVVSGDMDVENGDENGYQEVKQREKLIEEQHK